MSSCPPGPLDGGCRLVNFCPVFLGHIGAGDLQEQFDPGGGCEEAGKSALQFEAGPAPLRVLGWALGLGARLGRQPAGRIARNVNGGQALAELIHQNAGQDRRHGLGGAVVVVAADQAAAAGQVVDALDGG
jgi:hypothetical protein